MILFVTSGGLQAELTILAYLTEDVANSPAVRDPVSLFVYANYYYRSYYYYHHHYGKKNVTKAQKWNRGIALLFP